MARRKKTKKKWWILLIVFATTLAFMLGYDWWISRKSRFVRYPAFGISIPENYPIHGIDVSRYQRIISWDAVKEMKVKNVQLGFVFIKATEGIVNTDPQFRRNWKKSKQAGMVRGAYHFFLATKDGREQAQNFISAVDLEEGDLPPVVDIEQTYGVSLPVLKKELKEWLDVIEYYYEVKPIIYTNVDFYSRYLGKEFNSYPLWAAHYFQYDTPRINRQWDFWQHSEQGRVNGILSKVDFNVFNGDSLQFRNILMAK
ncbi:MAG TPA: GH25 family lysozyme [Chitinophagaceae bacterium]|nr:GH25 family lysozyme [Chitinophagaceae bacterium]